MIVCFFIKVLSVLRCETERFGFNGSNKDLLAVWQNVGKRSSHFFFHNGTWCSGNTQLFGSCISSPNLGVPTKRF